jgi:hypothetical protein
LEPRSTSSLLAATFELELWGTLILLLCVNEREQLKRTPSPRVVSRGGSRGLCLPSPSAVAAIPTVGGGGQRRRRTTGVAVSPSPSLLPPPPFLPSPTTTSRSSLWSSATARPPGAASALPRRPLSPPSSAPRSSLLRRAPRLPRSGSAGPPPLWHAAAPLCPSLSQLVASPLHLGVWGLRSAPPWKP